MSKRIKQTISKDLASRRKINLEKKKLSQIDILNSISKKHVSWLLACGFSNKAIKQEVPVTDSQISYVVKKTGLRRTDYRNGTSPVAKFVLNSAKTKAMEYARPKLMEWESSLTKKTPLHINGKLR